MDDREQANLDFYIEKPKNILRMIFLLLLLIPGLILCGYAFIHIDLLLFAIGAFMAVPSIGLFIYLIKRIATPEPYITLTEEGLIINAFSRHAIVILWDDINGYHIRHLNFNRFIEVLFGKYHYFHSMSRQSKRLYKMKNSYGPSHFAFPIGDIKRKDRRKLISELDRLAGSYPNLTNQIYYPEKLPDKKPKAFDRINQNYFLKSFGYSLIFAILGAVIVLLSGIEIGLLILIFIQFIFFPFSKLFYDVIIGFKLKDYLDKQEHMITIYIDRLMIVVYLLIYFLTIIFAPLGMLYLVISGIRRGIKRKEF